MLSLINKNVIETTVKYPQNKKCTNSVKVQLFQNSIQTKLVHKWRCDWIAKVKVVTKVFDAWKIVLNNDLLWSNDKLKWKKKLPAQTLDHLRTKNNNKKYKL